MSDFVDENAENPSQNCVKLFVGQIPREMDEDTLIPYFAEFGPILELTVIRDRISKQHKGCAFVTYLEAASASQAIDELHDKIKLGSAINPLQVRIAECQVERENKLFIGMLPKTVNEEQLHDMFVRYGDLREVHIIRGPEGSSKGCAFVKFVEREAALLAIEEMNNRIPDGSTRPLVIKFADIKKHGKKVDSEDYITERMGSMNMKDNYWPQHVMAPTQSLLYYPSNAVPQQIIPMQSYIHYGSSHVHEAAQPGYVIPNYAVASQSPPMMMPSSGASSRQYLPQSEQPRRPQDASRRFQLISPSALSMASGSGDPYDNTSPTAYDADSPQSPTRPPEGPTGANLFIYHLPRDLTDADLATLFAPFGNVISAKVFVDKKTSDSKGFGFVSFDSTESADASIASMNGFQIGSKRLKVQHKRTGEDPQLSPGSEPAAFNFMQSHGHPAMVQQNMSHMNYMQGGMTPQYVTQMHGIPQSSMGRPLTHVPAQYGYSRGHSLSFGSHDMSQLPPSSSNPYA